MIENAKIQTVEKVDEFLKTADERMKKASIKTDELISQKESLEEERDELSKALIDAEIDEDTTLVSKINERMDQTVSKIEELDRKIESYNHYSCNYSYEIYNIMHLAATEFIEGKRKYDDDLRNKLKAKQEERDIAKAKYEKLEKECHSIDFTLMHSSVQFNEISKAVAKIIKYMPIELIEDIEKSQNIKINTEIKIKTVNRIKGTRMYEDQKFIKPRDYSSDMEFFLRHYYYKIKNNPVKKEKKMSIIEKYFKKSGKEK